MRWASGFTALVLICVSATLAEQLPIKGYSTEEGLGSDVIHRILRDSQGFLWFCTRDGISRFDGQEFTNYTMDQGLPDPSINDLIEDQDGLYWVASNGGGVALFDPKTRPSRTQAHGRNVADSPLFTVFPVGRSVAANRVNKLLQDRKGKVWAGTDDGLFVLDGEGGSRSFERFPLGLPEEPHLRGVGALIFDRYCNLWIGTNAGLWLRTAGGDLYKFSLRPTPYRDLVNGLLEDRDGSVWIGHEAGLLRLDPATGSLLDPGTPPLPGGQDHLRKGSLEQLGEIHWYSDADGYRAGTARGFDQTADGAVWVASSEGLTRIFDGQVTGYDRSHGLLENHLRDLASDSSGNLWIASLTRGAMKLVAGGFATYRRADGLGDRPVTHHPGGGSIPATGVHSILEGPEDDLFVVSGQWVISRFEGKGFVSTQPKLPDSAFLSWGSEGAYLDRSGRWWFLTSIGLFRFAPVERLEQLGTAKPVAVYTHERGLAADRAQTVFEGSDGVFWVGSAGAKAGLSWWDQERDRFVTVGEKEGFPEGNPPSAFCEGPSGTLWVGYYNGGLVRYSEGHATAFKVADGLPAGGVSDLHVDRAGVLWIATTQGGLARVEDPSLPDPLFVRLSTSEGLSSNNVRSVTDDRWGRIYAGTVRGIDRIDPETGQVRRFTTRDGLANNFVSRAFRDHKQQLWFGTHGGLSRLVPRLGGVEDDSPVWIGGLRVGATPWSLAEMGERRVEGVLLEAGENVLSIDYFGLSFGIGRTLEFEYKIEGSHGEWSPRTTQRNVTIAGLDPGKYRFLVRAVRSGAVSASPAIVEFIVTPPFWRNWWFLVLLLVILSSGVYSLVRARLMRMMEMERVRTRIATDLHDDIGSSLSQIAILSEVVLQRVAGENKALTQPLARIASVSRDLLDSVGDIVWAINPRRDRLGDLHRRMRRFASDLLTARGIGFVFRVPDQDLERKLDADTKQQVYLLFKEALNNSVRHSGASNVEVDMGLKGDFLVLGFRDDGCGFDPVEQADGHGLAGMKQRTLELGGELVIETDLGRGTHIRLIAPRHARGRTGRGSYPFRWDIVRRLRAFLGREPRG